MNLPSKNGKLSNVLMFMYSPAAAEGTGTDLQRHSSFCKLRRNDGFLGLIEKSTAYLESRTIYNINSNFAGREVDHVPYRELHGWMLSFHLRDTFVLGSTSLRNH